MGKAKTVAEFEVKEVKSAYWDKELIVTDVPHSENIIRVSVCTRKDVEWLNMREHYKSVTGEFLPGKHGMAIRLEDPSTLDSFIRALTFVQNIE